MTSDLPFKLTSSPLSFVANHSFYGSTIHQSEPSTTQNTHRSHNHRLSSRIIEKEQKRLDNLKRVRENALKLAHKDMAKVIEKEKRRAELDERARKTL